jgi:hypothetical protein
MVKCEVSKGGCVLPPNNAPVDVLIRINRDGTEECFLNPDVTWFFPCHYRENNRVPCGQFRDVIEKFMQEFKKMLEGGAILYAVNCEGYGLRWFAVLDSIDTYCDTNAVYGITDDCIIL